MVFFSKTNLFYKKHKKTYTKLTFFMKCVENLWNIWKNWKNWKNCIPSGQIVHSRDEEPWCRQSTKFNQMITKALLKSRQSFIVCCSVKLYRTIFKYIRLKQIDRGLWPVIWIYFKLRKTLIVEKIIRLNNESDVPYLPMTNLGCRVYRFYFVWNLP